ncbi:uncharacterized protein LOC118755494 [Rhagoletis pomonella]|uniref:uncharacterized protein LOC118755494 n=1 Tax=Rhagoletis pomonella TaxID=28610 RepID=UPI0017845567|nr:uncharacterized protein LOC118755494 [Rhagoletis pomonella]
MTSLNLRTSAKSSITRIFNTVHTEGYSPYQVEMEHILGMVQQYWDRFVKHHLDLVAGAQSSDIPTHDTLYASTEEQFNKVCIKLRRLLLQCTPVEHDFVRTQAADLRLDPVSIPPFDGQVENWLVFKDMFETMVHQRTDLDPTYKLSKLRQYVKPESVPMVTGLYTGGYEEVWAELKRRYDNSYLLSQTHVQRILALPTDPRDTQKVLRDIIDCVRNSFRALSVMGLPVTQWDVLAIPILLPKLPVAARNDWGMSLKDNDIPRLEDLLSFIERRAMNMPAASSVSHGVITSSRHTAQRGARAHLASAQANGANTSSCPHCSENHRLAKCHRWRNLAVTARWETVRRLRLCFNCLRDGHVTRDCSAGVCTVCRQKHHTLLCRSPTVGSGTSMVPTKWIQRIQSQNLQYRSLRSSHAVNNSQM